EWTSTSPPVARRVVSASIRLSAGQISTSWIEIHPSVMLTVPAIPVPTVLLLFQDTNFKSNKLVVVPSNSPIVQDDAKALIEDAFGALNTRLDDLGVVTGPAQLFVDNLGAVKKALDDPGQFFFRKADSIGDLS